MPGAEKTIEELFAEKKPTAMFDANLNSIRGNGGCNNYNGAIKIEGNKIDLTAPIVSTKMACLNGSNGEYTYFNILTTVNNYNIVGDELEFFSDKVSVLKFSKKQ